MKVHYGEKVFIDQQKNESACSIMDGGLRFNAPSREAIYKRAMKLLMVILGLMIMKSLLSLMNLDVLNV